MQNVWSIGKGKSEWYTSYGSKTKGQSLSLRTIINNIQIIFEGPNLPKQSKGSAVTGT